MSEKAVKKSIEDFKSALKVARTQFLLRGFKSDGGRRAAMIALWATIRLIQDIQPDEDLMAAPLTALLFALEDLESEVVAPILATPSGPGRDRDSAAREVVKAAAAATLTSLMDSGFKLEEAGKKIAQLLRDCGMTLGGRYRLTYKTVQGWREQIKRQQMLPNADMRTQLYRDRLAVQRAIVRDLESKDRTPDRIKRLLLWDLLFVVIQFGDVRLGRDGSPGSLSRQIGVSAEDRTILASGLASARRALLNRTGLWVFAHLNRHDRRSRRDRLG